MSQSPFERMKAQGQDKNFILPIPSEKNSSRGIKKGGKKEMKMTAKEGKTGGGRRKKKKNATEKKC